MQQAGMWDVKVSDYVLFSECLELPSCVCLFARANLAQNRGGQGEVFFGVGLLDVEQFWHDICISTLS